MTFPDYSLLFWLTAVLAVIFIGVGKAGFGGGIAVIATPLMALTIPVSEAAALLLPILIVADMFSIYHYRRTYDTDTIKITLPGALLGIVIGSLLFGYFSDNERALEIMIGVLALIFVLFQATRALIFGMLTKYRPPALFGFLMGTTAGFTSTLVHAGGPPFSLYVLPQKLPRTLFVGTTVVFFTILNLVKLIPYSYLGLLKVGNLSIVLILLPVCFAGVRLGIYLNGRFNEYWFNWLIYTLLFFTGIQLIIGQNILDLIFLVRA